MLPVLVARVRAPATGLVMEVLSTEPAMQFYTGLQAGEPLLGGPGKSGRVYLQQQSLCLEPRAIRMRPIARRFRHLFICRARPAAARRFTASWLD